METKPADEDPDLSDAIVAALKRLDAQIDAAIGAGMAVKPKKRGHLCKPYWEAIRYLLLVEHWSAARIAALFDISESSIWMRCKREKWREARSWNQPDPVSLMTDLSVSNSLQVNLMLHRRGMPKF